MPDRAKVDVEIWEIARPMEDVNWNSLGTIGQRAVVKALEAADTAMLLTVAEDGTFQVYALPNVFKV